MCFCVCLSSPRPPPENTVDAVLETHPLKTHPPTLPRCTSFHLIARVVATKTASNDDISADSAPDDAAAPPLATKAVDSVRPHIVVVVVITTVMLHSRERERERWIDGWMADGRALTQLSTI